MFSIQYHILVKSEDEPKLSSEALKRIRRAIESKLISRPEIFGKPLRNSLSGHRTLRVGDHRVIFAIRGSVVQVLFIGHRSVAYKKILGRTSQAKSEFF